jgi:hypothetical protein
VHEFKTHWDELSTAEKKVPESSQLGPQLTLSQQHFHMMEKEVASLLNYELGLDVERVKRGYRFCSTTDYKYKVAE